MQQIKKLSLKLFIHYSQDWECLQLGEFIWVKEGCFRNYVFKHDLEIMARINHHKKKNKH